MAKLRCNGCKAGLIPEDKSIQFITCGYCRKTNKNPNFKEIPRPTHQSQSFNQKGSDQTQSTHHTQQQRPNESLAPFLTPRRIRRRHRFRRSGCGGCCGGCGCGCLVIFIIIIGLLITFIEEITQLIYRLVELVQ